MCSHCFDDTHVLHTFKPHCDLFSDIASDRSDTCITDSLHRYCTKTIILRALVPVEESVECFILILIDNAFIKAGSVMLKIGVNVYIVLNSM